MRTFVVEFFNEVVELALLLQDVGSSKMFSSQGI